MRAFLRATASEHQANTGPLGRACRHVVRAGRGCLRERGLNGQQGNQTGQQAAKIPGSVKHADLHEWACDPNNRCRARR